MRGLVLLLMVMVIVGFIGFQAGWFALKTDSDEGKTDVTLTVKKANWQKDRDNLRRDMEEELKEVDAKIEQLRDKAAGADNATRAKLKDTMARLEAQRQRVVDNLGEFSSTTEDGWQRLRERTNAAWKDFKSGVEKAWSHFQ